MILFPAIDIKEGKVVRLVQGRFDQVTEYSYNPMEAAKHWKAQGAQWLHIVDLDGAKTGQMANIEIIKEIAQKIDIPVQVGGGIRSEKIVGELISAGIKRVVLGTKAFEDQDYLKKLLNVLSTQIIVSLDCVNEHVMKNGWVNASDTLVWDFIKIWEQYGLKNVIYTDVTRDGMLTGPRFDMLKQILNKTKDIDLIASGGVSNIDAMDRRTRRSRPIFCSREGRRQVGNCSEFELVRRTDKSDGANRGRLR